MEELIDIVLKKDQSRIRDTKEELLRRNNLNKEQWNSFVELIDDLDLNRQGAVILLEEIKSGRLHLQVK